MKKVCVVWGGNGREREISASSGRAVITALKKLNYSVSQIDFSENFIQDLNREMPNVVFNAMHGSWGEDGVLPTLLDFLQIPYTHSGRSASGIGMNKTLTCQIARSLGISILPSEIYTKEDLISGKFRATGKTFLKPNNEGSTIGCFCVNAGAELSASEISEIAELSAPFYIAEEFCDGAEVSVGILGEEPIGGVEIRPKSGYYSYEAKYTKGKTDYFIPPNIAPGVLAEMEAATLKLYKAIGARGVSRADFIVRENKFWLLEINTHPGFTELSLVPQLAKARDISFEELIKFLTESATFEAYSK